MIIDKDPRYGWTITHLAEETDKWIDENVKIESFGIARAKKIKKASASGKKYNYYACPCCGNKFYSIYNINATCDDCGCAFEQYK